jgi:cytochrome P450
MCMHPEIQKRAQAEIDAVVGHDRLPGFEDRPHLPYIEAICKETMRYHAVVPNGELSSQNLVGKLDFDSKLFFRSSPLYGR